MFNDFVINKIVKESNTIKSFYLVPKSGQELAPYLPGQFVTVLISTDNQKQPIARNYTLSDRPDLGYYRITVKREASGLVSSHLTDKVSVGDIIQVSEPTGNFYLDVQSDDPVLLLSGGVGITPMMGMLEYMARNQNNRKVLFLHSSTNKEVRPMAKRLLEIKEQNHNFNINIHHSRPISSELKGIEYDNDGIITFGFLKKSLHALGNVTCYLCGPSKFMETMFEHLKILGIQESNIKYEFFGDSRKLGILKNFNAENKNLQKVIFSKSNITATWENEKQSILELAESLGIIAQSSCRMGTCATCETKLLHGEIGYDPEPFIDPQEGHILICCSQPLSDVNLYL